MVIAKTVVVFVICVSFIANDVCQANAKVGYRQVNHNEQEKINSQKLIELHQQRQEQNQEQRDQKPQEEEQQLEQKKLEFATMSLLQQDQQQLKNKPEMPEQKSQQGQEKSQQSLSKDAIESNQTTTTAFPETTQITRNYNSYTTKKPKRIYNSPWRPFWSTKNPEHKRRPSKRNCTRIPAYNPPFKGNTYTWDSPESQLLNENFAKYLQFYQQQQNHFVQRPLYQRPVYLQEVGSNCLISSDCKSRCCVLDSKTRESTCRNMSRLYEPCNDAELKGGLYNDYCPCEIERGILTSCERNVCQIARGYDGIKS